MIKRSLLLSLVLFNIAYCEDMLIFDDSDTSQMPQESIQEQTSIPSEGVMVYHKDDEVDPSTKEPLIVDDMHGAPTVIEMSDYQRGYQEVDESKSHTEVSKTNDATQIIKYINPQMKTLSLSFPTQKIGFWQLLDDAMQKSAAIILKEHDVAITKANVDMLKSQYYPNLSLKYYHEYYHGFSRDGRGSTNIAGSTYPANSEYRNSLSLNLDYEVYNFGAKDLKQDSAKLDLAILDQDIELEKERIAKDLLENYTKALKSQERIRMYKKIMLVKSILLKNTNRLYDAGFAAKTDVRRLRIDMASIEKKILRDRLSIVEALKNIQILSNVNINIDELSLAMLEPSKSSPKAFEESALASKLKLEIEKKVKEVELLKKEYLPTIAVNGSYQIYGGDRNNVFDAIGDLERNNWNVAVIFKWDIFNGFKTNKSIQVKKLELEKLVERMRLEKISYQAKEQKREILRDMIGKLLREESVLLDETAIQKDLLSRLQKAGNISIMEVDKIEVSRLESELEFKIEVIDQVKEDILSQLIM